MYTSHRKASVFRGYVEHKLLNAMEKLTKSLPLFKERGCTVSLALDIRTNRRKSSEYPLSVRFTLERKAFYYPVGGSYTAKEFSDICNYCCPLKLFEPKN